MKPAEQGRFCLSCQKTVVDFSNMTDRQLLEYFSSYSGNTCGRFHKDQLNRDIVAGVRKPNRWYKYILNAFVPALLIANKSSAQGSAKLTGDTVVCVKPDPREVKEIPVMLGRIAPPERRPYPVEGRVVDDKGNPLPGASVVLKGANRGTTTDAEGKFKLMVPLDKPAILQFSYVGFEWKEVKVEAGSREKSSVVLVSLNQMVNGYFEGVVVTVKKPKKNVFHKFSRFIADSIGSRSLVLYPNAAKPGTLINISYPLERGKYFIQLYSATGQVLQQETFEAESKAAQAFFRLQHSVTTGQYIIAVTSIKGKRIGTGKLVVQ